MTVHVVGAGLAGSEAALVLAAAGIKVTLHEMRPYLKTPAHQTDHFGELVCSNSLGSMDLMNGKGLLKKELSFFGSNLLHIARSVSIPAGKALAVDRWAFQTAVTEVVYREKNIEIELGEVTAPFPGAITIIATGPLTSEGMSGAISRMLGSDHLYFYDAISPIVDADSLDMEAGFFANRYGKGNDYLNFPLTKEEFEVFYTDLVGADTVTPHPFEKERFFESCMPIEVIAGRGEKSLLFGPMRPVGLVDPRTGRGHFAVIQLRRENASGSMYNLVGFQTRMKQGAQKRVFARIPGLKDAKFFRYGSIHRNTYINSPVALSPTLQLKSDENIFFAGQLCGVEGYVESISAGLVAGVNVAMKLRGEDPLVFPPSTMTGALMNHISSASGKNFQPSNANYGLLPQPCRPHRKEDRRELQATYALEKALQFKDLYFKYDPLCVMK